MSEPEDQQPERLYYANVAYSTVSATGSIPFFLPACSLKDAMKSAFVGSAKILCERAGQENEDLGTSVITVLACKEVSAEEAECLATDFELARPQSEIDADLESDSE